jgi:photosystem II stability/assembly factor-like uncharacterized protein
MKKCFACLLLLISINSFAQSGWIWSNPSPQGNNIYATQFFPSGLGYASAYYSLMKTTNYGANWIILPKYFHDVIQDIYFINETTGYVSGNNGLVYFSSDGGNNWQNRSASNTYTYFGIAFINANTGIGVCNTGKIKRTTNGGLNWAQDSIGYKDFFCTTFIDANTGYAAGNYGAFFVTTNAGVNWINRSTDTTMSFKGIHFLDVNTGYAHMNYDYVKKTTNGGLNWTNQLVYSGSLSSINFLNASTGFVCGWTRIYSTTNGGTNWALKFNSTPFDVYTISFANANTGFVGAYQGMTYRTTNGGNNWFVNTNFYTNQYLRGISFESSNVFSVGDSGKVLFSSNSGVDWTLRNVPTADMIFSVANIGSTAIAVGQSSKVYRSTNLGLNWSIANTVVSTKANNSVQMLDANTGYIAADSGRVFKTINGGVNWTTSFIGQNQDLRGMYFINALTGYVCGYSGYLRKTTDGAASWQTQTSNTPFTMNAIHFYDANKGVVACNGGKVIFTTNGGNLWTEVSAAEYGYINDVQFADANNVYAAGDNGIVSKSTNAGASWTHMPSFTYKSISSIHFTSNLNGFLCGSEGMLARTTTGGITFMNKIISETPEEYSLMQNYPNPFNAMTTIRFSIPQLSSNQRTSGNLVQLKVFDIIGRELATLHNGYLLPGKYEVSFNASMYSSGIYFYQLRAGDFVQTRKLVLLK